MSNAFIRAKRPDGSECVIDLIELETALAGGMGGEYLFFAESGKIVFRPKEDLFGMGGPDDENEQEAIPEDVEILPLDPNFQSRALSMDGVIHRDRPFDRGAICA